MALAERARTKGNLLIQALEYYAARIRNMKMTEEGKLGKELIEKDAAMTLADIHESLGKLRSGLSANGQKNDHVLCDALAAYESGLEETRAWYWKALGAKPKLANIDDAISAIRRIEAEYCVGHSG